MKTFNTKFKSGDILLCIKDVVHNEVTLFHKDESYIVDSVKYSHISLGDKTIYRPVYLVNGWLGLWHEKITNIKIKLTKLDTSRKYEFFSPDEEFVTDEKTHGASGMSSYGNIDIHFKSSHWNVVENNEPQALLPKPCVRIRFTVPVKDRKKWWEFWKKDESQIAIKAIKELTSKFKEDNLKI